MPIERRIAVLTTGGTIEKTYDEYTGTLANTHSIVRRMLARLRLTATEIRVRELMSKDSLDLTDADRDLILQATKQALADPWSPTGVVILHGTDTLAQTGNLLHRALGASPDSPGAPDRTGQPGDARQPDANPAPAGRRGPPVPIVLTGAMRPFAMQRSDGVQNLTEALFATGVLEPGVWCVFHGRALRFPGVQKDRVRGTFVRSDEAHAPRSRP